MCTLLVDIKIVTVTETTVIFFFLHLFSLFLQIYSSLSLSLLIFLSLTSIKKKLLLIYSTTCYPRSSRLEHSSLSLPPIVLYVFLFLPRHHHSFQNGWFIFLTPTISCHSLFLFIPHKDFSSFSSSSFQCSSLYHSSLMAPFLYTCDTNMYKCTAAAGLGVVGMYVCPFGTARKIPTTELTAKYDSFPSIPAAAAIISDDVHY